METEVITIPITRTNHSTILDFITTPKAHAAEVIPEILFMTSYPPRECGIATYSQDLLKALDDKFGDSFLLRVCALESGPQNYTYPEEVTLTLDTNDSQQFKEVAHAINDDDTIKMILIQHEFGLFQQSNEDLILFMRRMTKPIVVVYHTVLPNPNSLLRKNVIAISELSKSIIVMTKNSAYLLSKYYGINNENISVIPHGTHLVPHIDKTLLKSRYGLEGKKVISTFGLLSSGKGIETTIDSMPAIIEENPDAVFFDPRKDPPKRYKI